MMIVMLSVAIAPTMAHAAYDTSSSTRYEVTVEVDPERHVITGTSTIIYYNREPIALDSLYLTLYPNAFDEEGEAPLIAPASVSYPEGFDPGSITVDVTDRPYEVVEDTFLRIDLTDPLEPGESVDIELDFVIQVPHLAHRFGHHDGIIYAGNCLPLVCPYKDGGWVRHPYTARGDPFYSESAHWSVSITVPTGWTVASTGAPIDEDLGESTITTTYVAPDTRDFAFSCSEQYEVATLHHGATTIRSYYRHGHEEGGVRACELARQAMHVYENRFGPYPYDTFSIAETHLGAAGMEYPHLIFVDQQYYTSPQEMIFEVIIAHEVAHQWWYGVVGNDQVYHSFIDESLAQLSTLTYFEEHGDLVGTTYYENYLRDPYDRARKDGISDIIDRSLQEYGSDYEYMVMAYWKGPLVLDMLRWTVGSDDFYEALSDIYDKHAFGIIDVATFENEFKTIFPEKDLDDFFDVLLRSDSLPDVVAHEATYDEGTVIIDPKSEVMVLPVEARVTLEDGSTMTLTGMPPLEMNVHSAPVSYVLDPRDRIVESNEENNAGTFSTDEKRSPLPYVPIGLVAAIVIALLWRRKS